MELDVIDNQPVAENDLLFVVETASAALDPQIASIARWGVDPAISAFLQSD